MWNELNRFLAGRPEVAKASAVFYSLTIEAFHEAAFMRVRRVLDRHRSAVSLQHCLGLIEKSKDALPPLTSEKVLDIVTAQRRELEAVRKYADPILVKCDWELAHLDERLLKDAETVATRTHATFGQLYATFVYIFKILDDLMGELFDTKLAWQMQVGEHQFRNTGRLLELGYEVREKLIKERRWDELRKSWESEGRVVVPTSAAPVDPEEWAETLKAWGGRPRV